MSVLNTTPPTELAAKQAAFKQVMLALSRRHWVQLNEMQREAMNLLWHGQEKGLHTLTVPEALEALGTDAVEMFDLHSAFTAFIIATAAASQATPSIILPSNAFTEHVDGTITLDDPLAPYDPQA
jgi:hypothetical protein